MVLMNNTLYCELAIWLLSDFKKVDEMADEPIENPEGQEEVCYAGRLIMLLSSV